MSVHIMKGSFQIFDGVEDNLWDIVVSCEGETLSPLLRIELFLTVASC